MQADDSSMQERLKQLEGKCEKLEDEFERVEDEIKQLKDENKHLEDKNKHLDDKNKQLGDENKQLKDENEQLKSNAVKNSEGKYATTKEDRAANPGSPSQSGPNISRTNGLRAQAAPFIPASIHQASLTSREDASHHEERLEGHVSTIVNAPLHAGSPRNTDTPHSASRSMTNDESFLVLNRSPQADNFSTPSCNVAASAEAEGLHESGHISNGSHSSTPHPAAPVNGHGSTCSRSDGRVQPVTHTHTQSTTSTSTSGSKRKLSQSRTSCSIAPAGQVAPIHTPSASVDGRSHEVRNGDGQDDASVQSPPKKRRFENVAAHYSRPLADDTELKSATEARKARLEAQSQTKRPARAVLGSQDANQPTGDFQSLDGVMASTVINNDETRATTNNNDVPVHNPSVEERAAFDQERRAEQARRDQERRAERAMQDEINDYCRQPTWARGSYNTGDPTYEEYIV